MKSKQYLKSDHYTTFIHDAINGWQQFETE